MSINTNQANEIKELLRVKIKDKLKTYERETSSMPFLAKLMQDTEKVAAYSFIHSLATTLGMSMYEQIAEIIAKPHFDMAKVGYDVAGTISTEENTTISSIMQGMKNKSRTANKDKEVAEILKCKTSNGTNLKIRADLFLKRGNDEFYIEIKTAKPNIDVFNKSKQKLLEWVALRKKKVTTILAIPYNPYHPEPYSRFTMQGFLDEEKELYVAEKFWELLGGKGSNEEVITVLYNLFSLACLDKATNLFSPKRISQYAIPIIKLIKS